MLAHHVHGFQTYCLDTAYVRVICRCSTQIYLVFYPYSKALLHRSTSFPTQAIGSRRASSAAKAHILPIRPTSCLHRGHSFGRFRRLARLHVRRLARLCFIVAVIVVSRQQRSNRLGLGQCCSCSRSTCISTSDSPGLSAC